MKRIGFILILGLCLHAHGQDDPAQLARDLTQHLTTDRQKVTAIFRWITDHIGYRTKSNAMPVLGKSSRRYNEWLQGADDTGALKPVNERVAISVLRNGVAICEGYARLFTTLCDYAGIETKLIAGYARPNGTKPVSRFGVNHFWNAVNLEGNWYLMDATWASGYVTAGGTEFVREYDPNYFLATPEQFIRDHYPDDIRFTFLPHTQMPQEFYQSPFLQKSYVKYSLTSYFPSKGVIEAALGDTVHLELIASHPERDKRISPDMLVDSTIFSQSNSLVFLQPARAKPNAATDNILRYILPVNRTDIEWLYLLYNEDMVLRYKVNVRRP
ncbi:MAG: hypothetical protein NTW29_06385 [Bacteroidetes bacterium]|nr:hypothetical protein [Bacteroidota bacterium]